MSTSCSVRGCTARPLARGLCNKHYKRWSNHGDANRTLRVPGPKTCAIEGCVNAVVARNLCNKHYRRWWKHHDVRMTLTVQGRQGCFTPGCTGSHYAKGLCQRCYFRQHYRRRTGSTLARPESSPCPFPQVQRCWAEGCDKTGDGETGLCAQHRRLAEEWNAEMEEAVSLCSVPDCGAITVPQRAGTAVPLCPVHDRCAGWISMLQDLGVKRTRSLPWDEDWLSAKFLSMLLGTTRDDQQYLGKAVGTTPLFRIVATTLGAVYLQLPTLVIAASPPPRAAHVPS